MGQRLRGLEAAEPVISESVRDNQIATDISEIAAGLLSR